MRGFCIDAAILGTEKHLVSIDDEFSWALEMPDDVWCLTGNVKPCNDYCLDSLFKLGNNVIDLCPPERFISMMKTVAKDLKIIPWQHVMPARDHRTFVKKVVDQVKGFLSTSPIDYFEGTWVPGNNVLARLQRVHVNQSRFESLIQENVGNIASVETFAAAHSGLTWPVTYDRFGTLTGRLTVLHGPRILTLKREYRDVIVARPGSELFMIDFNALEPRVLLYEAGGSCRHNDLYENIAGSLSTSRANVKIAVIGDLYGRSKQSMADVLDIHGIELDEFIGNIRSYFKTRDLLARIKQQFIKTGQIVNRYGRPVVIDEPLDHVLINYYAQSTGADVALLGFKSVLDDLATKSIDVKPCYVLHDAIILEAPVEHTETILGIKSVKVPGYVQSFGLKATRLIQ